MKLTAAPFKGMRMSASFVNNWSNYRGEIPSISGTSSKTYGGWGLDAWKQAGYDYPNLSAAFMFDYSASNNFLISARAGYAMSDTTNQQIGNDFTTYLQQHQQLRLRRRHRRRSALSTPAPINYSGSRTVLQRQKLEKYSANLDLSYYVSLGGEHAWKAGAQLIRDQEDYANSAAYPMVNLYWDRTCSALSAYGVPTFRGTYGYYVHPRLLDLPLRLRVGHLPQQLRPLPPGFLDDRRPVDPQRRRPDGIRSTSRPSTPSSPASPSSSSSRTSSPPARRRLRRLRGFHPQDLRQLRHLLRRHEALPGRRLLRRLQVDHPTTTSSTITTSGRSATNTMAGIDTPSAATTSGREEGAAGLNEYMGSINFRVPVLRHDRPRPEARVPARDLHRCRKEADRGPVPVRPPRPEAPHPTIEDIGVEGLGGETVLQRQPRQRLHPGEVRRDPEQRRPRRHRRDRGRPESARTTGPSPTPRESITA